MPVRLNRAIESLKKSLLTLGAQVEDNVRNSVRSLDKRDESLAKKVMEGDLAIDHLEVDLEEECLKALALYQPVAIDLRFIICILKINNDLERIGDIAVNIAERSLAIAELPRIEFPYQFSGMAERAQGMLKRSLDALVNMDAALAHSVCAEDDEVDGMHREMYALIKDLIRKNPEQVDCLTNYLSISRLLERIADHATNIAEDVIYLTQGEIVRHKLKE